jgi:hypothetical protein
MLRGGWSRERRASLSRPSRRDLQSGLRSKPALFVFIVNGQTELWTVPWSARAGGAQVRIRDRRRDARSARRAPRRGDSDGQGSGGPDRHQARARRRAVRALKLVERRRAARQPFRYQTAPGNPESRCNASGADLDRGKDPVRAGELPGRFFPARFIKSLPTSSQGGDRAWFRS